MNRPAPLWLSITATMLQLSGASTCAIAAAAKFSTGNPVLGAIFLALSLANAAGLYFMLRRGAQ